MIHEIEASEPVGDNIIPDADGVYVRSLGWGKRERHFVRRVSTALVFSKLASGVCICMCM